MTRITKASVCDAVRDIGKGMRAYRIWLHQSWLDIKIRYRRSTLGPLWITINLAVMVFALGLLYSALFRVEYREFLPYFAAGVVAWNLFSSILLDATSVFISAEHVIKQMNIPLSTHVFRCLARNFIIFLHNSLVLVACNLFLVRAFSWRLALLPLYVLMLGGIFFFLTLAVGIFSTRFRDVTQIIASILQVLMLFTPIFWMKRIVPEGMDYVYNFNPFFHFIELLRNPVLGQPVSDLNLFFSLACLALAALVTLPLYARYRRRISYWL